MSKFDVEYKKLVGTILSVGKMVEGDVRTKYADGTPAYYKSIIGYQFRLDNSDDEAHIITTRYAPYKSALREIFWIWKMRSNKLEDLRKLGCKFWDEWELDDGTIGPAYGEALKSKTFKFDNQVDYIINEIKNNPNSRRIISEIWIPSDLDKMALTPCVHLTQWSVVNGKLYLEVRQRSCDVALGLVSNVFQYSVLHKLIAKECNLEPADLIWTIHNAHIYDRHIKDLTEQICYRPTYEKFVLDMSKVKSFSEWNNPDDITIPDYAKTITNKVNYEVAI